MDELWSTTALIYVDNKYYYTVKWWTPEKEVRPSLYKIVPNSKPSIIISPAISWHLKVSKSQKFFGRNDDYINLFWDLLTFTYPVAVLELRHTESKEDRSLFVRAEIFFQTKEKKIAKSLVFPDYSKHQAVLNTLKACCLLN